MAAFPFHYQDCHEYCGAACLMMMLQSRDLPVADLLQSTLQRDLQKACTSGGLFFSASPCGIAAVATSYLAGCGDSLKYEVFPPQMTGGKPPAPDGFAAEILTSLDAARAPVFALVQSGGHWILIYGWSNDGGVRSYHVRWPRRLRMQCAPGLPHDAACGSCPGGTDITLTERDLLTTLLPVSNPNAGRWRNQTIIVAPRTSTGKRGGSG